MPFENIERKRRKCWKPVKTGHHHLHYWYYKLLSTDGKLLTNKKRIKKKTMFVKHIPSMQCPCIDHILRNVTLIFELDIDK